MDVIVMPTAAAAAKLTAQIIADAINAKPNFKLGLATGRTMEPVYANLAKLNKANKVDFSRVTTFNLDEYVWPKKAKKYEANKDSYRYYMNYHLFNKINIDIRNTNVPDGFCDDVDAAAVEYDNAIAECGGLDIQLLGIGRSGHIGFNEPLSSFCHFDTDNLRSELSVVRQSRRYADAGCHNGCWYHSRSKTSCLPRNHERKS